MELLLFLCGLRCTLIPEIDKLLHFISQKCRDLFLKISYTSIVDSGRSPAVIYVLPLTSGKTFH